MKIKLVCTNCSLPMENNIYGPNAVELLKKYGTIINGRPFTLKCFCGNDLEIQDDSKVAEL